MGCVVVDAVVSAEEGEAPSEPTTSGAAMRNKYRQVLGLGIVHWLSLFSLIYVGVEVTVGGSSISDRYHPSKRMQADSLALQGGSSRLLSRREAAERTRAISRRDSLAVRMFSSSCFVD